MDNPAVAPNPTRVNSVFMRIFLLRMTQQLNMKQVAQNTNTYSQPFVKSNMFDQLMKFESILLGKARLVDTAEKYSGSLYAIL